MDELDDDGIGTITLKGRRVDRVDRTDSFTYVGQENDLFREISIAENVAYSVLNLFPQHGQIDDNRLITALHNSARDADLVDVIGRLQGGWQAKPGPRGRLLSGGERQRVCIARALYREELVPGSILLCDEGTSQLDSHTEYKIMNALYERKKTKGSTIILVAHRLKSLDKCDKILVMQNGEIVQQGTHDQLLNMKSGWYAEAWSLQQSGRALAPR